MPQITDRCWVEVDLDKLRANYRAIEGILRPGCQLMAVVKANAYGVGMLPAARAFADLGCRLFGVASFWEAHTLRKNGIEGTVLVLGPIDPTEVPAAAAENISVTVNSLETARRYQAALQTGRLKVHVKVDTGMARLGFRAVEDEARAAEEILALRQFPGLQIEGIFTHLFDAYNPDSRAYTDRQFARFLQVVQKTQDGGMHYRFRHCASSAGALEYPQAQLDMVRAGASLYGMFGGFREQITSSPVVSFRTRVLQVSTFPAGEFVGYNCAYRTARETKIAVAAVGNADGYYRYHSNDGWMLYKGVRVPVLGMVCMDMVMLDVSAVENPQCGDVVTIIGEDHGSHLSVMDVAGKIPNTLPHEVYNAIPVRVPRYYLDGGAPAYKLEYQAVCTPLSSK